MDRKRYMLFGYDGYYPCGGSSDVRGEFDTVDECLNDIVSGKHINDMYEILDLDTGKMAWCGQQRSLRVRRSHGNT